MHVWSISKIAAGYRQGRSVANSSERHHAWERHEGSFPTSWVCFKVDGSRRPCCHWPSMLKEKGGFRSDIRNRYVVDWIEDGKKILLATCTASGARQRCPYGESPIHTLSRCWVTPHCSGSRTGSRHSSGQILETNLVAHGIFPGILSNWGVDGSAASISIETRRWNGEKNLIITNNAV
ncbi:hypothetical protein P168DRAFT_55562 [Aspergillus campestris IBT 28561]|uniref:Uncharacterized protein n=1 Tax=Aspergillus campestris (strain IBT 28561) TaxID=1392248 RepID=A0A2I1CVX6_ASPC2|nr:uncharacterized protein P168DRAFT_55562 [Aspergillus campestris IBT 28561]PKY01770.1 hypothetical protein P168DRAFT_55562 [Aspergillus campestris IBT 28561]